MKKASEWQEELAGETSLKSIKDIQADALVHAAKLVHDISRGTHNELRAVIVDEVRDMLVQEAANLQP